MISQYLMRLKIYRLNLRDSNNKDVGSTRAISYSAPSQRDRTKKTG